MTETTKQYVTTKEECEKNIHGVCEGCGRELSAIETVDNSDAPTFWQGCEHCSSFRGGIEKSFFEVARKLVEGGELTPFSSMRKVDYESIPEKLEYFLDTQTAEASRLVKLIAMLLQSQLSEKEKELENLTERFRQYRESHP